MLVSPRPTGTSQEALGCVDLGRLNAEEVTSTREGRAELGDLRPRDMGDGSVEAPADPMAELGGVAPVTLLQWPMCLSTHVEHHGAESESSQLSSHEEDGGARL